MYEFQGPLPWEEHMTISASDIRNMSSTAAARIIAGIVDHQQAIADGGIDTPLRLCHFMAQLAHESAHFQVTREFASGAAYEGRKSLGNTHPGDGKRYRGRGLIQTTGRTNYQLATADIKKMDPAAPDFEADPTALEEFPWALLAGISYWRRRNLNAAADRDDVVKVTKLVNGGTNGLDDRKRYLRIAKGIWMSGVAAPPPAVTATAASAASNPILRKGDEGDDVTELQNDLIADGFKVFADGDFGEHTEEAVIAFQTGKGLKADGVVGAETWAALTADPSA
jgi:putative chitinase